MGIRGVVLLLNLPQDPIDPRKAAMPTVDVIRSFFSVPFSSALPGSILLGTALCMNFAVGQEKILFQAKVLDENCPGGYQVSVADVDGDHKEDVLTLGKTVRWLKNGSWTPFPITGIQTRGNIDLAPRDIDGDGRIDLAVASDFNLGKPTQGRLQWLRQTDDFRKEWQLIPIADTPSIHRIRWANLDDSGHPVLVSAPILGRTAAGPSLEGPGARLSFFRVPKDPLRDRWTEEVIDNELHVIHGLLVYDFDGDARDDLLTASFEGVHLFQSRGQGEKLTWTKRRLAAGEQNEVNAAVRGSSEIRVGQLKDDVRFLATIEPWHGNKVVVYTSPEKTGAFWDRHVISEDLDGGHALAAVDVDGDGRTEIVAGYRGKKGGVLLFQALDDSGTRWSRETLDEGTLACQCLFVADVPGTGRPSLVGIGGSTHNVELFRFDGH